ncbi:MAG: hypothetical protein KIT44_02610 [Opitutaceae bacterium]|nr:hypothetical protein [Opitutaceae bacterium]
MNRHLFPIRALCALIGVTWFVPAVRPAAIHAHGNSEIVLFPFDDHSLPFNRGLVLNLVQGRKHQRQDPQHPNKPVLDVGKPGDPDYPRVYFYGTVIQIDGEYRMWYTGHDGKNRQVCYAVSPDGVNWTKPRLGLVEYNGSKENNLVSLDGPESMHGVCVLVLYEPEDPDPERRFKMLREIAIPGVSWPVYAAFSADGLNWKSLPGNKPINPGFRIEPSGLVKFDGAYYVNGHSNAIRHPIPGAQKRSMQTFVSYDFENWSSAAHLSFRRDNIPPRPILDFEGNRGEQVHVGASLWNRGNVLLGFYGQYHNETNDRRTSTCDLGLIVSNNAINFREPIPDFKIIPAHEEPDRTEARLIQGQGFQNIGDRTLVYYGIWTSVNYNNPTGVRIATWPRDRLGYYTPSPGVTGAHCISAPFELPRADARVYLNADGLSPDARLEVEILDEQMRPIPGFSAAEFSGWTQESGFRLPATWRTRDNLAGLKQPIRVRVNFAGRDAHQARLHAIYIE